LFEVRRVDIECFGRELEDRGRARAHLDRNELGSILVTAGLSSPRDHALVSLLALNGLRVSEAIGANIEALGLERGHRTLTVLRKGGKSVTTPLARRVARAVDLAVGERVEGPIFLGANRDRLDRHAAGRIVRRVVRRAGIGKRVGPHTLRHAFITAALDAGVPLRDVQQAASHADPRTTMQHPGVRCRAKARTGRRNTNTRRDENAFCAHGCVTVCRFGLHVTPRVVQIRYFEVQIPDFSAVSTDGAMDESLKRRLNDDRIDQ
jgi:integrase